MANKALFIGLERTKDASPLLMGMWMDDKINTVY